MINQDCGKKRNFPRLEDLFSEVCRANNQDRFVETKNGKYKILPFIAGCGGTSVVRLGERVSDQKLFALKFFKNASINDIQSAEAEYERSKALGFHPHLVNTVDFDTDITYPIHPDDGGGTQKVMAVLVMDYCPHGNLIDLLMAAGNNTLSEETAIHLSKQLLTVLEYIHSKKIAHCDLKWEQVLLDNDFNGKLADFGSAAEDLERRSDWLGTPSYWSPEQHAFGSGFGLGRSSKADMFAAGMCFTLPLLRNHLSVKRTEAIGFGYDSRIPRSEVRITRTWQSTVSIFRNRFVLFLRLCVLGIRRIVLVPRKFFRRSVSKT